jgi:hypothetical protein
MKKLITLVFVLISFLSTAQSFSDYKDYVLSTEKYQTKKYCRAYNLNVALVTDNQFIWDTLKQPVHFNIDIDDSVVIVNSARKQIYKKVKNLPTKDPDVIKWYFIDEENKNGVLWFIKLNKEKEVSILSEYDDIAWFYVCGQILNR